MDAARAGLVFLTAFLVWLLNHPYQGVWHDANVYGLLAAHWLNPQGLAGDLFFSFGSQGSFSLFTPLYGALVGWLGLDRAAWWVTLGGGLLWTGACLALARTMLGAGFASRFAVFLGAVVVVSYSPNANIFVLGENFATARSLAIPLALASVAALAAQRQGWSFGLALAATALHPLQGVWSLAAWVLARLRPLSAVTLALLPVIVVLLLGALNLDLPYLRLMTDEWLEFARTSAPDVVFKAPLQTRLPEYSAVLAALWLGARTGSEQWRALHLRLLLLGLGGLGMALLASYVFPVEIVVQVQPWRVMALLIPMAAVAVLDLGRRAWQASAAGRLSVVLIAVLTGMNSNWLPGALWAIGMASLMPVAWIDRLAAWAGRWQRWFGLALAVPALSAVPNILAGWEIAGTKLLNPWWTGADWLQGLLAGNSWHFALLLALLPVGPGAGFRGRMPGALPAMIIAFGAVSLALVATLGAWDRRSPQYRGEQACYLDTRCPPHPFRQWVKPGSTVYWPQRELAVWFELGTASYFGQYQAIGRVFSSGKFHEWQRRQARVAAGTDPRQLCSDPLLDWVVLPAPVPGLSSRAEQRYAHLYGCAELRAVTPTS